MSLWSPVCLSTLCLSAYLYLCAILVILSVCLICLAGSSPICRWLYLSVHPEITVRMQKHGVHCIWCEDGKFYNCMLLWMCWLDFFFIKPLLAKIAISVCIYKLHSNLAPLIWQYCIGNEQCNDQCTYANPFMTDYMMCWRWRQAESSSVRGRQKIMQTKHQVRKSGVRKQIGKG